VGSGALFSHSLLLTIPSLLMPFSVFTDRLNSILIVFAGGGGVFSFPTVICCSETDVPVVPVLFMAFMNAAAIFWATAICSPSVLRYSGGSALYTFSSDTTVWDDLLYWFAQNACRRFIANTSFYNVPSPFQASSLPAYVVPRRATALCVEHSLHNAPAYRAAFGLTILPASETLPFCGTAA